MAYGGRDGADALWRDDQEKMREGDEHGGTVSIVCDQGHGPLAADWELDDDGKETGVALWVCPICCWSLPRNIKEAE